MDYGEFVMSVLSDKPAPEPPNKKKTAEDIMAQFAPMIEADKSKRRGG